MSINEENDTQGKVKCEICGKWFKYVAIAHLKKHGINSMEEYRKRYPNAKVTGEAYCQMRKELASKQMSRRWKESYNSVYSSIHNKKSIDKRVKTRVENNKMRRG